MGINMTGHCGSAIAGHCEGTKKSGDKKNTGLYTEIVRKIIMDVMSAGNEGGHCGGDPGGHCY